MTVFLPKMGFQGGVGSILAGYGKISKLYLLTCMNHEGDYYLADNIKSGLNCEVSSFVLDLYLYLKWTVVFNSDLFTLWCNHQ